MSPLRNRIGRCVVISFVMLAWAMPTTAGAARPLVPVATNGAQSATVSPALAARLAALVQGQTVEVFVRARTQADLSVVRERDRRGRAKHIESLLRAHALSQQLGIRSALARLSASGQASLVQTWWIDNAVSFTGTAEAVRLIAARADVASVSLDEAAIAPAAGPSGPPSSPPAANVAAIGAPTLWSRGITGAGVVVADLDTGVDATHPDLAGSWRGGSDSWFDPYGQHATPVDVNGHGTWTTSVMVGRDGSGQAVGVAPDAHWIAARVFDDTGRATLSGVHAALQWVLDPSGNPAAPNPPQVVNASWSSTTSACSLEFQPDLAAIRAAGIVPVFAAGNSGPAFNSGTDPATLPEALAVGSVDSTDTIDVSSSRGPSACGGRTHFPDVVAPGVDIPVDDLYGGSWTVSGTSLAAPHVAGALALLLSAHPGLTADQQQAAVTTSAVDLGAAGVDDTYGAGRLDVVAAEATLGAATPPGPITSAVRVSPDPVGGSAVGTVAATLSAATGGGVPVSARASIDGAPAAALSVSTAGGVITATGTLSAPSDGTHVVAVSAADAAGTWGAPSTASFVVDRSAPVLSSLAVAPSPTAGASTITLTATATDPVTGAKTAEAWVDADPGVGLATPTTVTAGSGGTATLRVVLATSGLSVGSHTVSVRVVDGAANSSAAAVTFTVSAAPPAAFANGFESGNLTGWASSGGAGLSVATSAALSGRYGLNVSATRTGGWVRANVAGTSGPFNVRVLFDPRAMSTGAATVPILVQNSAQGVVCTIEYHRISSGAQIRVTGRTASGAVKTGAWVAIPTTGTSVLEVDGQPASGTVTLYVANVVKTNLTGLSTGRVPTSVDFGLVGAQPTGVTGAIRLDAVAANRSTHIGTSTTGL